MVPVVEVVVTGATGAVGTGGITEVISFAGAVGLPDGGVTASAVARLTVAVFVMEEPLVAVCCGAVTTKSDGISADWVPRI